MKHVSSRASYLLTLSLSLSSPQWIRAADLPVFADSFTDSNNPTMNYGALPYLQAGGGRNPICHLIFRACLRISPHRNSFLRVGESCWVNYATNAN